MTQLIVAVGLVLAIEGTLYALFPGQMQKMMARMMSLPVETLRLSGVVALAAGVGLVWLMRGF